MLIKQQLWDPTGNLDVDLVDMRSAKILAKVNFFKENPKHASNNVQNGLL